MVLLFLASLLCGGCGETRSAVVEDAGFLVWEYEIDQPIRQLEEVYQEEWDGLQRQQFLNYTSSNIAFLYEIKVRLLFEEYLSLLPDDEKHAAVALHKVWLAEAEARYNEAYSEYEGGTVAALVGAKESIRLSKERIEVLNLAIGDRRR